MSNLIAVHQSFERHWPFVADYFYERWSAEAETQLARVAENEPRTLGELVTELEGVTRLAALDVPVSAVCLRAMPHLQEATFPTKYQGTHLGSAEQAALEKRGVSLYLHKSEGFWGQSVAEFALALTICALRRIPQNYREMLTDHEAWLRYHPSRNRGPATVGVQFSDDSRFTSGTISGKRVRVVGMGNIGSRYASFVKTLGADVAAWDPFVAEAHFHRTGVHKEWHLEELVQDAEIFAPMLPLTDSTRGLLTKQLINQLPRGCLVVLATRALICDVDTIRGRVVTDELSLAADVFDIEPLPLDDPLLGRHNVVHTPHLAGRTLDANRQWVDDLISQFRTSTVHFTNSQNTQIGG